MNNGTNNILTLGRITTANSRFAKAGVSCFYDSKVVNSSFVHQMKFSAENPRLRKAVKRSARFAMLILLNDRGLSVVRIANRRRTWAKQNIYNTSLSPRSLCIMQKKTDNHEIFDYIDFNN